MAEYFTQTVFQEMIPDADMTALERLLLLHIFEAERDGDAWYFFAEQGEADMILVERAATEAALAASECPGPNVANIFVTEQLADVDPNELAAPLIELDLSTTSWAFIIQDIVRRSPTLKYVSVISAYSCSRMRPDSFSGSVVVISAGAIVGKSTYDLLEELVAQALSSDER